MDPSYSAQGGSQADPGPTSLESRDLFLAPVTPDDYKFLHWLASASEIGYRWRFHGVILPFETFIQQLSVNVFCQFVVRRKADGERLGHVLAYAADLRNGHAFIGNVTTPSLIGEGVGTEAQIVFVDYLFDLWDFKKLYVEVPEFSYAGLQSWIGDDLLDLEGRLVSHFFYKGRYWDQFVLAIHRAKWELVRQDLPRMGRQASKNR